MDWVEKIGNKVILYFPRKHIYRAIERGNFGVYLRFNNKQDFKSIEELREAITTTKSTREVISNDPYNTAIRWLRENDKENQYYQEINLLVNQYYYGIEPKRELENLLISIGVLNNK